MPRVVILIFIFGVPQGSILRSVKFLIFLSVFCLIQMLIVHGLNSGAVFQGDSLRTNIQLDFGDGTAVSYSNLSWTEEGIKHIYKSAGIFRVTALAENTLGYDSTTLFLHVTCKDSFIFLPVCLSLCFFS